MARRSSGAPWGGMAQAGALLQNGLAHQPRPDGKGKILRRNGVGDQIHLPVVLGGGCCVLPGELGCQRPLDRADVVALFLHTVDVALGHQLLVGVFHRDDADLQMGGQRPLGGQLLPRRQPSGEDVVLDAAIQLLIQADAAVLCQWIGQHDALHLVLTRKIKMDILIIPVHTIIQLDRDCKGFFA